MHYAVVCLGTLNFGWCYMDSCIQKNIPAVWWQGCLKC